MLRDADKLRSGLIGPVRLVEAEAAPGPGAHPRNP